MTDIFQKVDFASIDTNQILIIDDMIESGAHKPISEIRAAFKIEHGRETKLTDTEIKSLIASQDDDDVSEEDFIEWMLVNEPAEPSE
jgi:hypothetical protein